MIWNMLLLAIKEIRRNMLHSALTILGIVIGVAAVITMINLGHGVSKQIENDIAKLGDNLLILRPGVAGGRRRGLNASAPPFVIKDVKAIRNEVPNVLHAAPSAAKSVPAVYGNQNWTTTVYGTERELLDIRKYEINRGRNFNSSEIKSGQSSCIIGDTIRRELFADSAYISESIRLGKISCRIIASIEKKGESSHGRDMDDFVLVPLKMLHRRMAGNQDISNIFISATSPSVTKKVKKDVEELMRQRRKIPEDGTDNFSVRDISEIAELSKSALQSMTLLLGSIAAISLLVGGIGIMNIMLVSVTERTREIGIRLAIGAMEKEVLTQFLVEAVVLSLFGGFIGILLGFIASVFISKLLQMPSVFDFSIVILAFVFSAGIGIIFGFFPARKAAKLNPIDALRHE